MNFSNIEINIYNNIIDIVVNKKRKSFINIKIYSKKRSPYEPLYQIIFFIRNGSIHYIYSKLEKRLFELNIKKLSVWNQIIQHYRKQLSKKYNKLC